MTRANAALALVMAISGCTSETQILGEPPFIPVGEPRPVDNTTQVDLIVQVVPPVSDVLWVIDNSCSMEDE